MTVDIHRCVYQRVRRLYYRDREYFCHAAKKEMMACNICNPFLTSLFNEVMHIYCCIPSIPVLLLGCFLVSTPFGTAIPTL